METDIVPVARFFITPRQFTHAKFSLGRWSLPLTFIALIWNLYLSAILFSPLEFPVTGSTFNYSPVIFGYDMTAYCASKWVHLLTEDSIITIFGILTFLITPADKWLPNARLGKVHQIDQQHFE